jgi:hypothetical protein
MVLDRAEFWDFCLRPGSGRQLQDRCGAQTVIALALCGAVAGAVRC